MTTDALSVVIVVLFTLFAGVVAYIIRPLNRRKSRRRVALSAGADSQDPPFIERRKASKLSRLKDFFSRRRCPKLLCLAHGLRRADCEP
jgi:hypothetical protein